MGSFVLSVIVLLACVGFLYGFVIGPILSLLRGKNPLDEMPTEYWGEEQAAQRAAQKRREDYARQADEDRRRRQEESRRFLSH